MTPHLPHRQTFPCHKDGCDKQANWMLSPLSGDDANLPACTEHVGELMEDSGAAGFYGVQCEQQPVERDTLETAVPADPNARAVPWWK